MGTVTVVARNGLAIRVAEEPATSTATGVEGPPIAFEAEAEATDTIQAGSTRTTAMEEEAAGLGMAGQT